MAEENKKSEQDEICFSRTYFLAIPVEGRSVGWLLVHAVRSGEKILKNGDWTAAEFEFEWGIMIIMK